MSETIARLMGTNEEDDEEVIEVDIKGEDEDDDEENHIASSFMVNMDGRITTGFNSNPHQHCLHSSEPPSSRLGGGRRSRPLEEKEWTKLRERHRRAITAKILAGLRRHGNYNLRVRADINDVIAALAREAGWVVLPDGTTFPAQSQGTKPSTGVSSSAAASSSDIMPQQTPSVSLQGFSSSYQSIEDQNSWDLKSVLMHTSAACDLSSASRSLASVIMGDEGRKNESYPLICGSIDAVDNKQVLHQPPKLQERDFSGTPYIPVYVMLPFGVISMNCELTDPDGLLKHLRYFKAINVDGIMVNCWWGVVEAHSPQEYKWVGYKKLFQIVRELKLKLQVVMSFHVCGGNFGDDLFIHLPHWVTEIGRTNPDIYFTDKDGRRNHECLSWGIDKERILRGRTAVEVYYDFMRSFRSEFDEFFEDGIISMIEVGLGPCGELRYPSYPVKHGWRYPGIGEFQCYDQFLLKSLRMAAEARGHSFWARGPDNTGSYNSQPNETGFFCEGGDYDGYYGRFFLKWYTEVLLDHADRVLSVAKLAFEGTCIVAKLPRIHWWYKTSSHAAELTAGFYNPSNRDGYATVMAVLKKHGIALSFSCSDVVNLDNQDGIPNANADPVALSWQVLNAAWDVSLPVFGENSLPCHSRDCYNRILDNAKPFNDPDGRHLLSFAYHRLSPLLMERQNFTEFERFVKRMHGEVVLDLPA